MRYWSSKTISGLLRSGTKLIAGAKRANCMVCFPNCKINLGLKILRKREDGYHDLETCFYPLPLKDILEINRDSEPGFSAYGLPIPGDSSGNLCVKAWQLLKKDFPDLSPVHIHLYKH